MKYSRNVDNRTLSLLGALFMLVCCEPSAHSTDSAGTGSAVPGLAGAAPVRDWAPYVSAAGGYFVYGPGKFTTSEINVPTPVGDRKIPVTYFRAENNIFYVSSHPRDARIGGADAQILEAQAQGILAKFEKFEVAREPFVAGGITALRLRLTRPDSYKIIDLYVTASTLYTVVTDLPSPKAARIESYLFRTTFTILK